MNFRPLVSGKQIIEVEFDNYCALLKKEERLNLVENWLKRNHGYKDLEPLKDLLGMDKENEDE